MGIPTQITKCENCHIDFPISEMFLNNTDFNEMLAIYEQKGIDTSSKNLRVFLTKRSKGLCKTCGAMVLSKWGLVVILKNCLEEKTLDNALDFYNMATKYNEIVTQQFAIKAAQEVMVKLKMDPIKANAVIVALMRLGRKSQHVTPQEKSMMLSFKNKGMSNLDLSRIFQRSKETIHRTLKEVNT